MTKTLDRNRVFQHVYPSGNLIQDGIMFDQHGKVLPGQNIPEESKAEPEEKIEVSVSTAIEPESGPPLPESVKEKFANSGKNKQVEILEQMSELKEYDLLQLKKPLNKFSKNHRLELFERLAEIPDVEGTNMEGTFKIGR